MKYWTHEERATLRRLAPTHTAKEIGEMLGRSTHAVQQKAVDLKVSLMKRGDRNPATKHPDALVEAIRAMHDDGTAPAAIASQTGVPLSTVKAFVYYCERTSASLTLLERAPSPMETA